MSLSAAILGLLLLLYSCRKAGEALAIGEKMKTCFQCNGTGKMKCPDRRDGFIDCLGECLKLTQGTWIYTGIAGHSPTALWQKFPTEMAIGWTRPCPICHGKGKI